jgi:hypothetical protein
VCAAFRVVGRDTGGGGKVYVMQGSRLHLHRGMDPRKPNLLGKASRKIYILGLVVKGIKPVASMIWLHLGTTASLALTKIGRCPLGRIPDSLLPWLDGRTSSGHIIIADNLRPNYVISNLNHGATRNQSSSNLVIKLTTRNYYLLVTSKFLDLNEFCY